MFWSYFIRYTNFKLPYFPDELQFSVVILCSCILWSCDKHWINEYWTIAPWRNIRLGSHKPLIIKFSSVNQYVSTLATSCEELTHWKRLWCWEGLGAGGKRDDRGWDGWMASPTWWTWVWVNSGSWWWTGRPGVLWFMGSQRVRHDWATELNWTESCFMCVSVSRHLI